MFSSLAIDTSLIDDFHLEADHQMSILVSSNYFVDSSLFWNLDPLICLNVMTFVYKLFINLCTNSTCLQLIS